MSLKNDIVRSNKTSKNRHTYIASHGDPPFRRHCTHSVCRFKEDKEKKTGYSSNEQKIKTSNKRFALSIRVLHHP
jgi:hypothetical protein